MKICIIAFAALLSATWAGEVVERSECIFPFKYKGETYTTCVIADGASPWCSANTEYVGAYFYCNKQDADSYESNGGFLRAQQKLKENDAILKTLTEMTGGSGGALSECVRCDAAVRAAATASKELRRIADDNERRLSWMHEKRGKDIQAFTRSVADEIEHLMDCPNGFVEYNHNCYFFGRSIQNYQAANNECKKRKAELVAIHSAAENHWIVSNIRSRLGTSLPTFIGFNDMRQEGKFEWSDKSEVNYLNWSPGEPNAYPGENCAEMYHASGKWNDIYCSRPHNYVCKKYKMS